jgi:hypothetical protein
MREHGRYVPLLETAVKLARTLVQPLAASLPSEGEDAGLDKVKATNPRERKGSEPKC